MGWVDDVWTSLAPAREKVAGAPVQHRLVGMIPPMAVVDDPDPQRVSGSKFVSGGSYFALRLTGLHMTHARRFATQMLPLFVCLAEFGRPGAETSIPFSVGPDTIRKRLTEAGITEAGGADEAWIELRNLPLLRPQPVVNGNLSLFVGLYSVPGGDLVETLLNVMGDLGGAIGAVGLAPVVKTAQAVYGGFGTLLKLDAVRPLAEALDGRALPGTGSGYLLVGNAPPDAIAARGLGVKKGVLCDQAGRMVDDFDYCLLAVEHYDTLAEEGTGLAPDFFEEDWQAVIRQLVEGEIGAADRALAKLIGRIQSSPSLIEADRDRLIPAYIALYGRRSSQLRQPDPSPAMTRGAGHNMSLAIARAGETTREKDFELSTALTNLYERMSKPVPKEEVATDAAAVLREAAAISKAIRRMPEPGRLAAALSPADLLPQG